MTKSKLTKKALLCSILTILLSTTMLIGTTFAWFTDTASTSVNKIQAGTLDVLLEMQDKDNNWVKAEGETLSFVQASSNGNTTSYVDGTNIFWEPGCTYELQPIRITNNGNLALKYKISISGILGDAKLNDAITWTINDTEINLTEEHLLPNTSSGSLVIKGHMKEDAGNEYQGLSIDGIAITVTATQYTEEYDSKDNQYDKDAVLPVSASAKGNLKLTSDSSSSGTIKVSEEQTLSDSVMSVTYPEGVVLKSGTTVDGDDTDKKATVKQELKYVDDAASASMSGVSINAGQAVQQYELTLPVDDNNKVLIPITINYPKGLTGVTVYHNGKALPSTSDNGEYAVYDSDTGKITLYLLHASPVDILYDKPGTLTVTNADELQSAIKNTDIETIVLGSDITLSEHIEVLHTVVVDFNSHIISASGDDINSEQCVFEIYNTATSSNKLTFKDSVGGGKLDSTYGGICLMSNRAQFELNDVTIECENGTAIEVFTIGYIIDEAVEAGYTYNAKLENTSIVINSGKILVEEDGNSAISSGNDFGGNGHVVTINGGTIDCQLTYAGIYLNDNTTLTINNCNFSKVGNRPIFVDAENDNSSVIINDINFTGTGDVKTGTGDVTIHDIIVIGSDVTNYSETINGGTFTVNGKVIDY